MIALIKKDLLLYGPVTYLIILLFIYFMGIIMMPAMFVLMVGASALAFSPFFYDEKNKMNYTMISMPIKKSSIVAGRYVFSLLIICITLLVQWAAERSITVAFDTYEAVYGWNDYLLFLCLAVMLIAISYPLLYLIKNLYAAAGIILLLFMVGTYYIMDLLVDALGFSNEIIFNDIDKGFAIIAENWFPVMPYLAVLSISGGLFCGSIVLSSYVMKKKDF